VAEIARHFHPCPPLVAVPFEIFAVACHRQSSLVPQKSAPKAL
jgi:hypothetical protein